MRDECYRIFDFTLELLLPFKSSFLLDPEMKSHESTLRFVYLAPGVGPNIEPWCSFYKTGETHERCQKSRTEPQISVNKHNNSLKARL